MAKYNVTRINPDGFIHTQGFCEVIDSLAWALAALGHDVNVTQNWLSEVGETNIVFGAEVVAPYQRFPKNTIIFNLEQPSHPNMEKVRALVKGLQVWDFSRRNVEEWKRLGYDVWHVPIGFTSNLHRIAQSQDKDIDALFYGCPTPRRVALIEELKKVGLRVHSTAACYGGGRDNLISRSRLVLNVHHDGRTQFEIVRCSYLMANRAPVVSEISEDDDEYSDLKGIARCEYRVMVDRCVSLCRSQRERIDMADAALRSIRQRDFVQTVAATLDCAVTSDKSVSSRSVSTGTAVRQRYERGCAEGDMKDFLPWLRGHAKGNVLEIGVRDGASTSALLLGLEEHGGHLYSVDIQDSSHLFECHSQWTFIRANSAARDIIERNLPQDIDLLLIDGDHSRAGVLNDFYYAKHLRPGGCVLFHDIAPEPKPSGCSDLSWPTEDVRNVYNELCAALAPQGWTHEELPGRYGLGVLRKTA